MSAIWSLLNRFLRQSTSVGTQQIDEYDLESLVTDITEMLQRVQPLSSPCIYKVPDPLRKLNEEVYTPQIISIGPFHHGNKKLQTMEKYKASYLKGFVARTGKDIKTLIRAIEEEEQRIRDSYAETIPLCRSDFVKMILMDASFIVELFCRNWLSDWTPDDYRVQKPWLAARMQLDFMLLENQLPFFIIQQLFDRAFASHQTNLPSFIALTFHFFKFHNRQGLLPDPDPDILHFVDLLRKFYLPAPPQRLPRRIPGKKPYMYGATQLKEVGLKFEVMPSKCLLDLHYEEGVLKIPHFTLDDCTELYARNLMALEQCHNQNKGYVTDYFLMLHLLIKSEKDVDLLSRMGIVENGLGNNDATFINNLGTGIVYSTMSSNYWDICNNLKKFYEDPSHGWWASLRRDYFRTPWMAASTTAAVILLLLTLTQAVCSIISVLPHH